MGSWVPFLLQRALLLVLCVCVLASEHAAGRAKSIKIK